MRLYQSARLVALLSAISLPALGQEAAINKPVTIESKVQEVDPKLSEAIQKLDPVKAEEYNAKKDYDKVFELLLEPMKVIIEYDLPTLLRLSEREKALISYSGNELSVAFLRGKGDRTPSQISSYNYCKLAVDLGLPDTRLINPYGDPITPLLGLAISAYNLGRFEEAAQLADRYIKINGTQMDLAYKVKYYAQEKIRNK